MSNTTYGLYANHCSFLGQEPALDEVEDLRGVIFPYFGSNVKETTPLGNVKLEDFLRAHIAPSEKMLKTFEAIEDATRRGDKKEKARLKQTSLYYFVPSVRLTKRNYESITAFTGLMVAEYDKIGLKASEKLKRLIFDRFSSCICAYLSPSKSGVKFLFKIPVVDSVEEYKEYFYGLSYYLNQISGFDEVNQNPILPLFISYDFDMLIRRAEEVTTWTTRGFKENAFIMEPNTDFVAPTNISNKEREIIISRFTKKFEEINDNAHPQVVKACIALGGYVTSGYLSYYEAESLVHGLIASNGYMSKDTRNYQKTASQMINVGMNRGLTLNRK